MPSERDETREAFTHLRALAQPLRLRTTADREGWPSIPGRLGQIEYHGVDLAVSWRRIGQATS